MKTLVLLLTAYAGGALACSQSVAPEPAPQPRVLALKDLATVQRAPSLTVLSLPVTGQWDVAISQGEPASVRRLSMDEAAHIAQAHGRPAPASGLHFATLHPGSAQVFLTSLARGPQQTVRMMIDVQAHAARPVATVTPPLRWTREDQQPLHTVSYGDLIEITLPGAAREDWNTDGAEAAGLSFDRKRAGGDGLTTLVFKARTGGSGNLQLSTRAPGAPVFKFRLTHRPQPAC
jgi:hypothetical protein